VSLALLILLERLTPAERAVFVLREAFGYSHSETAQILELSEANCRQLQRRARDRLASQRPRFHPAPEQWRDLADRFLAAARAGALRSLERMLAEDVTAWTDGGGTVVGVLVLEMSGGEISALRAVASPGKLRFAARQAMGCHI
jgi:RNA polymerase sigma-70 factor (ECF subfamily)